MSRNICLSFSTGKGRREIVFLFLSICTSTVRRKNTVFFIFQTFNLTKSFLYSLEQKYLFIDPHPHPKRTFFIGITRSLWEASTFFFVFKWPKTDFDNFFSFPNFWTKIALFFGKYCIKQPSKNT